MMRALWHWLRLNGLRSEEFKRRTTAVEMGLYMSSAGIIYALVYAGLGYGGMSLMALLYVASFCLNLLLLRLTGRFAIYEQVQLLSVLLFPVLAHGQIGGFQNSSMVVLAVFLSPAAALLFASTQVARRYFYSVVGVLVLVGLWDYFYAPAVRLPRYVLSVFIVLIPLAIFTILYFLMENFRRKQEQLRAELQQSLDHLKATQNQLVQAEKMASLGELTAGIAHEIQNPLNFVNNFSDVSAELVGELQEALAANDSAEATALAGDLAQNLGKIGHHGRRAASIVKGMLEHSQTRAGERQPTDLNRLCDEYLHLAYQSLRAKDNSFNAALSTDFLAELPLVTVVGADVGRVLLNLFTNAFYAVRQRQQLGEPDYQPQVGVRTLALHQQVQIQVTDNGIGMSPAVQGKVFQPFFTTKPTGEGTGLGLSLSYDIITQGYGGTLSVESQEGQGTTFSVELPVS